MREGWPKPPADLRYLRRSQFGRDNAPEAVTEVITFLESIYNSVAENLPDVRDESWDDITAADPYGLQLAEQPVEDSAKQAAEKQAKIKKHQRGVAICPGRTVEDGCEERFLPAGTIKEYWIQFQNQCQSQHKASFPTFWRVSLIQFIAEECNHFCFFKLYWFRVPICLGFTPLPHPGLVLILFLHEVQK